MNDVCIPFKEPGQSVTGQTTAAVTGKRFLKISGDKLADGSYRVAHADAAGRVCGVSEWTAASGAKIGVLRGPGKCVPVTCAAAVDAFEEVEVGANGQATPLAAGVAVGYAMNAAAADADAEICLY